MVGRFGHLSSFDLASSGSTIDEALKPSYLLDLVLLLTAVVSSGTLILRELVATKREDEASARRAVPRAGTSIDRGSVSESRTGYRIQNQTR